MKTSWIHFSARLVWLGFTALLLVLATGCQHTGRVHFWEDYEHVFNAEGRVGDYHIRQGKPFVITLLDEDALYDVLRHTPDGKIDRIIGQNPAWEFIFYVECPVEDSLKVMNLLERYHCSFPVILDPERTWQHTQYGETSHYTALGVICDERGEVLGGSVIGTSQSFFDSEFLQANRELGWRYQKEREKKLKRGRAAQGAVPLGKLRDFRTFLGAVQDIEWIPLETDDTHLLGANVGLCRLGDGYLLYDRQTLRLYRYDAQGRYLNEVGRQGNGPGEYAALQDVQVVDGTVHVFAPPGKELVYAPDGTLLQTLGHEATGFHVCRVDGGLLCYYGYSGQKDYRVVFREEAGGQESGFLPIDAKLLALDMGLDVFSPAGDGGVVFPDSYSPTVYRFDGREVTPRVSFDFGRYALPASFFKSEDAFKAAEMMMATDYAVINRYLEGPRHRLVQLLLNDADGDGQDAYGFFDGHSWQWFTLTDYGIDPVPGPFRLFDGQTLCALFRPDELEQLDQAFQGKSYAPAGRPFGDADYILAKIRLK